MMRNKVDKVTGIFRVAGIINLRLKPHLTVGLRIMTGDCVHCFNMVPGFIHIKEITNRFNTFKDKLIWICTIAYFIVKVHNCTTRSVGGD